MRNAVLPDDRIVKIGEVSREVLYFCRNRPPFHLVLEGLISDKILHDDQDEKMGSELSKELLNLCRNCLRWWRSPTWAQSVKVIDQRAIHTGLGFHFPNGMNEAVFGVFDSANEF